MKKILALVLAVILMLSALSVSVFALDKTVEIYFMVDDEVFRKTVMVIGEGDISAFVDEIPEKTHKNPLRYEYVFKGWQLKGDTSGELYQKNTLKNPTEKDAGKKITYNAVFAQRKLPAKESFQAFIQSIQDRFNLILARVAEIFTF